MPSHHFNQLADNILELKRIYLDDGAFLQPPSVEQQEMARAFVVFAHAELEWFVERVCIDLSDKLLSEATSGNFSSSSLALIAFAALEPVGSGDSFVGKKGASRTLTSRIGEASSKQKQIAQANEGVRERHLTKLFVPLGLTGNDIDSAWLADVDSFASFRGAFAHMARSESRASHLGVNPQDVWQLCERIVWGAPAIPGAVASFQELDSWLQAASASFSAVVNAGATPLALRIVERARRFFKR